MPPDPSLGYAENFLSMLHGETPTEEETRAFEVAMILHAEHELNASTFCARVVAGTGADMHSAIVLEVAEIPPPIVPAMFACSRVAGWSAHILEQKRTGRLFRPSARYVGPAERSLAAASA